MIVQHTIFPREDLAMTRCIFIGLVTIALMVAPVIELSARGPRGGGGQGGSRGTGGASTRSGGFSGGASRGGSRNSSGGRSSSAGRSPSMSRTSSPSSRDRSSGGFSSSRSRPGASGGVSQGSTRQGGSRGGQPGSSRADGSGRQPSAGTRTGGPAFERSGGSSRPARGQDRSNTTDRAAGAAVDSRDRGPGSGVPSDRELSGFLDLPRDRDLGERGSVVDRRGNRPGEPGERRSDDRRPGEGDRVAERRDRVPDRRQESVENRTDRLNDRGNQVRDEARDQRDLFSDQWRERHQDTVNNRWRYTERNSASYWRRGGTWAGVTGWVGGAWAEPVYYDYGNTIVYQDGGVYQDGEEVASAEQYAQQAQQIAETSVETDPEKAEWMPLGTFAMVREKDTEATMFLQLAVSKEGIITGTYSNTTSDSAQSVEGHVDKKSQRAAWWIGDNRKNILETGIYNLTKEETPVLVHFGSQQTQTWLLVRLEESTEDTPDNP